jgi:predicted MPP superfamily phosphohydrolase
MSSGTPGTRRNSRCRRASLGVMFLFVLLLGCAQAGRLAPPEHTITPVSSDTSSVMEAHTYTGPDPVWRPLFADTLIGLVPGTGDSAARYLGRLRAGYTADTLNIILFGDNRPSWRSSRLKSETTRLKKMISLNPLNWLKGLVTIPIFLAKGLYPDLAIIRDLPDIVQNSPRYGREEEVLKAVTAMVDSLQARNKVVAAIINTGDLVKDGRYPAHWERFLKLTEPLYSRVPYFPVAGNHERTDTEDGMANWRTATGLPITDDRLYYCFDSADGWVRFIALDSNPMADPKNHWSRDVEVKYSDEQIDFLQKSLANHRGPAFVFMHHPPFSTGFHRDEWQSDNVLRERRDRMVRAMKESGISILATGHEHAYERALLTWDDAVLISLVAGGGGSPLHSIPSNDVAARMYGQYRVAGSVVKPENVFTAVNFHFVHLKLWFGGGEFTTYAVERDGSTRIIDHVEVDLKRHGVPRIDQYKIPIPEEGPKQDPPAEETPAGAAEAAKNDSTSSDDKLRNEPPPGGKPPR